MLNLKGFRAIFWVCVNQMVTTVCLEQDHKNAPTAKVYPMNTVTVLECNRSPLMDPAPLSEIYRDLGDKVAEETICRALEDLAIRLNRLQDIRAIAEFDELTRQANRMAAVAQGIGLTEVSIAARHVAVCAQQKNGVALEATLCRLERGFDLAISQVWDFRDF
jgi:hypothetical protein